jgi:dTMP kinase
MPLLVLEGLDGAGKSTQVKLLTNYFKNKAKEVFFLHFPRLDTPFFGELIADFLRGDFGEIHNVHPKLVASLYAGDRWSASKEIENYLKKDFVVILDRYVYSNLAYQCAKLHTIQEKESLRNWILKFEFEFYKIPRPDINIFLDVPIEFVEQKLKQHRDGEDRQYLKGKTDIHEQNIQFQIKVRDEYLYLCKNSDLIYLNCSENNKIATPEIVFNKIINIIENKIF